MDKTVKFRIELETNGQKVLHDVTVSTGELRDALVEVGKEGVDAKIKAMHMYRGVMRPYPHPRSDEGILGNAIYRGGQAGVNYAEAFQCVLRRITE